MTEIFARYSALALNNLSVKQRLTNESLRDGMTGLFNYAYIKTVEGVRLLDSITLSIGIAVSEPGIKLEDLLSQANQAMLEAKRTEKNRIVG